jgi:hypothetical protein
MTFTEYTSDQAALDWLKGLRSAVLFGGNIAPEEPAAERANYWVVEAGRVCGL